MQEIDPRDFGALESKVAHLETMVFAQGQKIDQLLEIANRGRGALWLTLTVGGILGALSAILVRLFLK
jgi:hypothetical protein